MDLWFSEFHSDDSVKFSIKVSNQLFSKKSKFQEIAIFESPVFGRFLTIDGYMMLTEKDEFIYHEMITHPAFLVNPFIKNVLVIGGGDGGALRELSKYNTIELLDICEIDETVINACKEFLPFTSVGYNDPRVNLFIADGLKFVRGQEGKYDLIIVDSTDPFGAAEALFTREFYGNCFKALSEDGILINQHESPFYDNDRTAAIRTHSRIKAVFPISEVYSANIPTYPSGHWLFGFASKKYSPKNINVSEWHKFFINTNYFNSELHNGAFMLPEYVRKMFEVLK